MTGAILVSRPVGAAPWTRLCQTLMDILLHLGAHRTATTTFQRYLSDHADGLAADGLSVWGPRETRKTIFPGLFRPRVGPGRKHLARRAEGRVRLFAQREAAGGAQQLLISDENLLGTCSESLRYQRLYPAAGERVARISAAFGGQVRRIVLSIRSPDLWWASAASLTVARGHPVPSARRFAAIAENPRTWRDVITDIACAAPEAEIIVIPFETRAGRPDAVLSAATGHHAPPCRRPHWLNSSPDLVALRRTLAAEGGNPDQLPQGSGRWAPFTPEHAALLRENYADDLHWLTAGADGLARLTEDTHPTRAAHMPPPDAATKGQGYDQGYMAHHR